ncbi:MAG: chemotaxis protein CheB [Hymenobacteraceae bacterium]|nr:chemotaxis protein CheB [Hymenobacteraceae bacterium]MDX5480267.1 chemotaxis protein CheB [Hymenobacteraceae bacterium]
MAETNKKIIVIGASAGGMQALTRLLAKLPESLEASVFIVLHLSSDSSSAFLAKRLGQFTTLSCKVVEHLKPIEPGTVYMAQADMQLLLKENVMLVTRGPRENQFRPSIDTLFRSAAAYHGANTTGVILTGFMTDGVVGMEHIKRSGGITVVQSPADAEFPVLPQNVLQKVEVDHVVTLDEMGELLADLVKRGSSSARAVPSDIWQEAQIAERIMTNSNMSSIEDLENAGQRTQYTCPECGGSLWEISQPGTMKRYRCHSGHAFNQSSLLHSMNDALEETLWVALRNLEERRNIMLHISQSDSDSGRKRWASMQEDRAEEMKVHIERLRELLARVSHADDDPIEEAG